MGLLDNITIEPPSGSTRTKKLNTDMMLSLN